MTKSASKYNQTKRFSLKTFEDNDIDHRLINKFSITVAPGAFGDLIGVENGPVQNDTYALVDVYDLKVNNHTSRASELIHNLVLPYIEAGHE